MRTEFQITSHTVLNSTNKLGCSEKFSAGPENSIGEI